MNTDYLFVPGKLTSVLDAQFGSSGKGKISSYITQNATRCHFACNAFSAQAGHWVRLEDGREFFYQHLNSCAFNPDSFEKLFIGAASCIELPALLREIEQNNVQVGKLGISPLATIILPVDFRFEKGLGTFDEDPQQESDGSRHTGTAEFGSTAHGVGSCTARKVLRRRSVLLAKDVPELKDFICDVPTEMMQRLAKGQSGLLEIAQGFALSLNYRFFPYCTSRNVTVSQGLSDMQMAPMYAGPVVLNFRTFPIRINSNKYIGADGHHLTWNEVQEGVPHTVYEGSSGNWYPDQEEISWEQLTESSGSPNPIMEITSVTKLPRRVATWSKMCMVEATKFNQSNFPTYHSINFANYVDHEMSGVRSKEGMTQKFMNWMTENLGYLAEHVSFVGTGALTEDTIHLK